MRFKAIFTAVLLAASLASRPAAAQDLAIRDPHPQLFFVDTDAGETVPMWEIGLDLLCDGCVDFFSATQGSPVILKPGSLDRTGLLYLDGQARIGINTSVPAAPLHVVGHTGQNARLVVQNPLPPPPGDVTLLQLLNAGSNVVRFAIVAGESVWTFDNNPYANPGGGVRSGEFRISRVGTGVAEFTLDAYARAVSTANPSHWSTSTLRRVRRRPSSRR